MMPLLVVTSPDWTPWVKTGRLAWAMAGKPSSPAPSNPAPAALPRKTLRREYRGVGR